jgi:hypothetical protein
LYIDGSDWCRLESDGALVGEYSARCTITLDEAGRSRMVHMEHGCPKGYYRFLVSRHCLGVFGGSCCSRQHHDGARREEMIPCSYWEMFATVQLNLVIAAPVLFWCVEFSVRFSCLVNVQTCSSSAFLREVGSTLNIKISGRSHHAPQHGLTVPN